MASSVPSVVQRQVARVSRRLFFRTFLDALVWCWVGALVVSAGWLLAQPYAVASPPWWLGWSVTAAALAVGTLLALLVAVLRSPSRLDAALLLDEKFALRERVTTSLMLDPATSATPAGQALLEDAGERVGKLDVGERFPVGLSWKAVLVPACVALLVAIAFFWQPDVGTPKVNADDGNQAIANAPEIKDKLEKIVKKPTEAKKDEEPRPKSKAEEQIDAELEKLLNKPPTNKEQLKQLAQDVAQVEEEARKREKELQDKSAALKEQLKNLDRFSRKDGKNDKTKDLAKDLAEGKFDKAKEEVEKLEKKLKDKELNKEDKEELAKQINDLKDELEKLSRQQEDKDKLQELFKKGEIDKETLERELEELNRKAEDLKDLKDLADQLQQAQQKLQEGDDDGAAEDLQKAAEKMKEMNGDKKELEDLKQKLDDLKDLKKSVMQGMDKQMGQASGRRPEKPTDIRSQESRVDLDFDVKGKKEVTDLVNGNSFKKTPSKEMAGAVTQATQEATAATEQQKVDRAAKEMYKGYFENLRKDAAKDLPPK
jgi:hypothetical protein